MLHKKANLYIFFRTTSRLNLISFAGYAQIVRSQLNLSANFSHNPQLYLSFCHGLIGPTLNSIILNDVFI